jgi:tetratricopeptide (TPR) repeat protein
MVSPPIPSFKYNPGILGDDALIRRFVVRHQCLELVLETLRENSEAASSNRHLLVVGPRGIGKTMLVRRVAAEVRSNREYGDGWFPIVFGEESYQVGSAGEFWLEALAHLSDTTNSRLDGTLSELREEHTDARLRERALAQLLDFADNQRKRLLLIVENLGMLCDQITPEAAWEIRFTLLNEPRIMLLATATTRFDAIARADQAWFELFAIHELKALNGEDSKTLWRAVTHQALTPGHTRAIRILTGGNPRLLTVLAGFAANRSFRELMDQLIHLIDDHTEYFKGHLDTLPPKERRVFVALLEQWNPVAATDIGRVTRISVNEVSALLKRLVERGAVEVFEERPRRKLYQAAERLYNIYYLIRRRGEPSDRVHAAVSFMVMFYDNSQLPTTIADLAREACGLPAGKTLDHFTAYAELARRASGEVWSQALEQTPPEFFDRQDAPEFIRRLPKLSKTKIKELLTRADTNYSLKNWTLSEDSLRQAIREGANVPSVWSILGDVLEESGRSEEAEDAYRKALDRDPEYGRAWRQLGRLLSQRSPSGDAERALRKATELQPNDACAWHYLGRVLNLRKRRAEAERACKKAIELDPQHVAAWDDLGITLVGRKPDEAEQAFRHAMELDPKDPWPVWNLARLLRDSGRHEDAFETYASALKLGGSDPELWSEAGHFASEAGSPEQAERIWEEALKLHPQMAQCALHLLEARLQRGVSAAALIDEAEDWIVKSGRSVGVLRSMSNFVLKCSITNALPRAENWAREAVSKERNWESAHLLALIYAAQARWIEALDTCTPVLDSAVRLKAARQNATDFLIQAAAAGYPRDAFRLLTHSKGVTALEPLLVGLQIYLGESPKVAKEIYEIGQDVAERIREITNADKATKPPT